MNSAGVDAHGATALSAWELSIVAEQPLETLGLAGDGDEISAIDEVERAFGVKLDYTNANTWLTVGDVFMALRAVVPDQQASDETWIRFAEAISRETGADPNQVTVKTLLLGTKRFGWRLWLIGLGIGGGALFLRSVW